MTKLALQVMRLRALWADRSPSRGLSQSGLGGDVMEAHRITMALGGIWRGHYGLAFCPAHQNSRTPALSLAQAEDGRLLVHCFAGCSFQAISDAIKKRGLGADHHQAPYLSAPEEHRGTARKAKAKKHADQAYRIWTEALPITGTLGASYLHSRGITTDLPQSLRFHPASWHSPSAKHLPAMVSLIEGAADFAVHRTYLAADGLGKSQEAFPRMMLGPSAGGAVRLSDCAGPLVVAEGIETALSLACGLLGKPATIWATLSASGMASLNLPLETHHLIIATDGDKAGQSAGQKLAMRAQALGWAVSLLPAPEGRDWNDILMLKEDRA